MENWLNHPDYIILRNEDETIVLLSVRARRAPSHATEVPIYNTPRESAAVGSLTLASLRTTRACAKLLAFFPAYIRLIAPLQEMVVLLVALLSLCSWITLNVDGKTLRSNSKGRRLTRPRTSSPRRFLL